MNASQDQVAFMPKAKAADRTTPQLKNAKSDGMKQVEAFFDEKRAQERKQLEQDMTQMILGREADEEGGEGLLVLGGIALSCGWLYFGMVHKLHYPQWAGILVALGIGGTIVTLVVRRWMRQSEEEAKKKKEE